MKCSNIFDRLLQKACKSGGTTKVGAIGLDFKGNPIASACNRPRFDHKGGSIHAEMAVMLMAAHSLRKIYIVRINKSGHILPLDPCLACKKKADDLGVKIYSVHELLGEKIAVLKK